MEHTVTGSASALTACGKAPGQHKPPGHRLSEQQPAVPSDLQSMYSKSTCWLSKCLIFISSAMMAKPQKEAICVPCTTQHHMGAPGLLAILNTKCYGHTP